MALLAGRDVRWPPFGLVEVGGAEDLEGRGIKPHLVKIFKLSNDKRFEEELEDVVELYLNRPPVRWSSASTRKAKSSAQPVSSLPADEAGAGGNNSHDYERHGSTTLFAALSVLTGRLLFKCMPRPGRHSHLSLSAPWTSDVHNRLVVQLQERTRLHFGWTATV